MTKFGKELIESLKQAAEIARTERASVTIPTKDRDRFEQWMRKPAQEVPALKELAKRPPRLRK